MMILFFIFLVLKLTGVIGWSWWWITAPLWAIPALILGIGVIVAVTALLFGEGRNSKERNP